MEFHALPMLSLPLVLQDVLIAVGISIALLAILPLINLGVLLPGLITSLSGPQPDQRGAYLEFGPAGASIISDPSPCIAAPLETRSDPHVPTRSDLCQRG
jgi:hypothetical protein